MAVTLISPADSLSALDRYVGSIAAKDIDSPEPTERAEFVSTIGDCTPANFTERLRENARQQGQTKLKHEAYHLTVSQTHEEADPRDPQAGHRQHVMVRALVKNKFPGHMAKLVTQRDNGKWVETPDGERVWQPGKWHTHCIIANASSREAVLAMPDGTERRYKAGRAIDGPLKNVHAIRYGPGGTDELVLEHLGYDNKEYVDACRKAAKGRGDRATTRDLAQRADPDGRGYSNHDELRVKLREARAMADSWDDYVARLAADGVTVRGAGKGGASYGWVTDSGVELKERARKLGNDFTRAEVEEQCAINAERIANGETLEPPERVVVPAPPPVEERPVPVFLTPDGKPPWDRDLDEYATKVRESGGTYEQVARERIDLALEDNWVTDRDRLVVAAPKRHGVTVEGRTGEALIALDTRDGRIAFEAGHLGAGYTGGQLDRRIRSKRRDKKDDRERRGTGRPAGGDAGRRPADRIGIERIDGAALAALGAENLRRAAEHRAELDDRSAHQRDDRGDHATAAGQSDREPDQASRGHDAAAGRDRDGGRDAGRSTNAGGRSATPLRDEAVRGQQERTGDDGDRGRGD